MNPLGAFLFRNSLCALIPLYILRKIFLISRFMPHEAKKCLEGYMDQR